MEKTLAKGLKLLETIVQSDRPRGVSELARELALTPSNVHRLLQTLKALGYLCHDQERGSYTASLRLFEMGMAASARIDAKAVAGPVMRDLAQRTGEKVQLSTLDGGEIIYLEKVESRHPVGTVTRLGGRLPAHCSAAGKAMLAWSPQAAAALRGVRLQSFTPHTIATPGALAAELERIRVRGYATARGEWHLSVSSVAAAVRRADGQAVAAISVSGPAERFKSATIRAFAPLVMAAAKEIADRLR